jgi:hypothetical protein
VRSSSLQSLSGFQPSYSQPPCTQGQAIPPTIHPSTSGSAARLKVSVQFLSTPTSVPLLTLLPLSHLQDRYALEPSYEYSEILLETPPYTQPSPGPLGYADYQTITYPEWYGPTVPFGTPLSPIWDLIPAAAAASSEGRSHQRGTVQMAIASPARFGMPSYASSAPLHLRTDPVLNLHASMPETISYVPYAKPSRRTTDNVEQMRLGVGGLPPNRERRRLIFGPADHPSVRAQALFATAPDMITRTLPDPKSWAALPGPAWVHRHPMSRKARRIHPYPHPSRQPHPLRPDGTPKSPPGQLPLFRRRILQSIRGTGASGVDPFDGRVWCFRDDSSGEQERGRADLGTEEVESRPFRAGSAAHVTEHGRGGEDEAEQQAEELTSSP